MFSLQEGIEKAREFLDEGEEYRILTHYDVDGVCSAGIIAGYLQKKGKRFHISFFRNVDKNSIIEIAKKEERVILTDMGSALIPHLNGKILIVDHHQPLNGIKGKKGIIHINAHLFGYDGSYEACASTLSYLIVGERKYAKFFLAGVMGDKQKIAGLNREVMNKLSIREERVLPLYGTVLEALLYSIEPFFVGISGRRDRIQEILQKLKIRSTETVDKLTDEEKTKLGSYLALNLLRNSKVPDAGKFISAMDFKVDGMSIRYLTELIDSACRTDNQSVALGYILGCREDFERMEVMRREYRGNVVKALYGMLENIFETKYIQYFYSEDPYMVSTLSTIGSMYLLDPMKVTVGLHLGREISISARIHKNLANKLNLGKILAKIASELGGNGGGHSVAAGATVPVDMEKKFLNRLNEEIEKSLTEK